MFATIYLCLDKCIPQRTYVNRRGSHKNALLLRNDLRIQKQVFYFTASLTQHNVRPNPYLIDDQIILLKRESSKEEELGDHLAP